MNHPKVLLDYYVSGAIERGESKPIIEQPTKEAIAFRDQRQKSMAMMKRFSDNLKQAGVDQNSI